VTGETVIGSSSEESRRRSMSVIEQFTTALDLQIEFSHERLASQTA
jgi:hypothetical protein